MQILDLAGATGAIREQSAALLVEGFERPAGWPTLDAARQEVAEVIRGGFAIAMIDDTGVLGWCGGLPEYAGRVWELHPMVVHPRYRRRGIGRALAAAFEAEAARRGGLTAMLGTDDDAGMTSLADVDLYRDVAGQIAAIRDLGGGHPFVFYSRLGYVVTGVVPDANGRGRPDILMSKRLQTVSGSRAGGSPGPSPAPPDGVA
jgi:aminoglycoside 6'-N-acetyltransferase I